MTNEELYAFRKMALQDASIHVGVLVEKHPLPDGVAKESKGLFNTSSSTMSLHARIDSDLTVANWLLEGTDLEVERYAIMEQPEQGTTLRDLFDDDGDDDLP